MSATFACNQNQHLPVDRVLSSGRSVRVVLSGGARNVPAIRPVETYNQTMARRQRENETERKREFLARVERERSARGSRSRSN